MATAAFHANRERAPHLEQDMHRDRLHRTAQLIRTVHPNSVVDLGCGDGGLLSLITDIDSWGYDFQPSNTAGWAERGVTAELRDVLHPGADVRWGELAVLTEVLEHVTDPHGVVRWTARHAKYVVASSPHSETPHNHAEEHAWAWDVDGYRDLFSPHWEILSHDTVGWCQIVLGRSRHL